MRAVGNRHLRPTRSVPRPRTNKTRPIHDEPIGVAASTRPAAPPPTRSFTTPGEQHLATGRICRGSRMNDLITHEPDLIPNGGGAGDDFVPRPGRARRWPLLAGIAAIVVAAGIAVLLWQRGQHQAAPAAPPPPQ